MALTDGRFSIFRNTDADFYLIVCCHKDKKPKEVKFFFFFPHIFFLTLECLLLRKFVEFPKEKARIFFEFQNPSLFISGENS